MKKAGLYVHFPFCRRVCFYCHFFRKPFRPEAAADYLGHLAKEIRLRRHPGLPVDTVYFGGGSPSLLTAGQLAGVLEAAARNFSLASHAEITLEANPEDLTLPLLKEYRAAGVNRLSIGAQSFQDRDLRFLKRTHGAAQSIQAITSARDAGFANLSIDLIIGLETQNAKSMEANFRVIEALEPAHVSAYILEGVPSKRPPLGGGSRPAAEARDVRHYAQARQALQRLGFQHYEVSNFCRPGKASMHNLKYWRDEPYVGIGASAAGYLEELDYRNYSDLKKYGAAVQGGKLPLARTRRLDPATRRVITGLRLLAGIPASAIQPFAAHADFLSQEGLLIRRGRNIAVPPAKILLLNEILSYFI